MVTKCVDECLYMIVRVLWGGRQASAVSRRSLADKLNTATRRSVAVALGRCSAGWLSLRYQTKPSTARSAPRATGALPLLPSLPPFTAILDSTLYIPSFPIPPFLYSAVFVCMCVYVAGNNTFLQIAVMLFSPCIKRDRGINSNSSEAVNWIYYLKATFSPEPL